MPAVAILTCGMSDEEMRAAAAHANEIVVEGDIAFQIRVGILFGVPTSQIWARDPQQASDAPNAPSAPTLPPAVKSCPTPIDLPPELMFRPPPAAAAPEPGPDVPCGGTAQDEEFGHFRRADEGLFGGGEVFSSPRSGSGGGLWTVACILIVVGVAGSVFFLRSGHNPPVQPSAPPSSVHPSDPSLSAIAPKPPVPRDFGQTDPASKSHGGAWDRPNGEAATTQPAQPSAQPTSPSQSDASVELAKTLAWPMVVIVVALIVLFAVIRALGTGHSVEVKWRVSKIGEGSMVLKKTVTRMPKRAPA